MKKAVEVLHSYTKGHAAALTELRGAEHFCETIRTTLFNRLPYRGLQDRMGEGETLLCNNGRDVYISGWGFDKPSRALIRAEVEAEEQ